jgi:hypothetical protein
MVSPSVAAIAMRVWCSWERINKTEAWEMLGYETGELLVDPSPSRPLIPKRKEKTEDQRVRRASLVRSQNNLGNSGTGVCILEIKRRGNVNATLDQEPLGLPL